MALDDLLCAIYTYYVYIRMEAWAWWPGGSPVATAECGELFLFLHLVDGSRMTDRCGMGLRRCQGNKRDKERSASSTFRTDIYIC